MMAAARTLSHVDYTVGWICALPLEMAAAKLMLDRVHLPLSQPSTDKNSYALGEVSNHNVVIACLPSGVYGTTSATVVAQQMLATFPKIDFGLMVGIGGGVPNLPSDIRLGDVVVGKPMDQHSGVIQYDFGKTMNDGLFSRVGTLNKPPQILLTAMANVESNHMIQAPRMNEILQETIERNRTTTFPFAYPGRERDQVFDNKYEHEESAANCDNCDRRHLLSRTLRTPNHPSVHYGLIASGNQVMKHSLTRDKLAKALGIICFEMEAAGLMDNFPCLVIRGICDYADSHKNKQWQGYGAFTAAAYAKELLSFIALSRAETGRHTNSCWMVPFQRNPRFVGRQPQLGDLEERIFAKDRPHKAAITGLGGVGKTQIALELAYRIREKYPDCSVFWIPSTSVGSVEQAYLSISQQLGLSNINPGDVKSEMQTYLVQKHIGRWLLIFDNADDTDMWIREGNSTGALKTYLPQSDQGFILFTSRNRQLAVDLVSSDVVEVPEMDKLTAITVLKESLIRKPLLNDYQAAMTLLRRLTFLPLAIAQTAAYINKNGIDLADYLSLLDKQEEEVIELLSKDFQDDGRYEDIKNPVATTWLISFSQIRRLNPLAAEYLSFLACINTREIPQSLLPPSSSQIQQQGALGLLDSYSLITIQPGNGFLNLHQLVHLVTRNWLRKEESLKEWVMKTGSRLNDIFPNGDHHSRKLWREYLPHAQFLLHSKEFQCESQVREDLAQKVGQCLYSDGRYYEAEEIFQEILGKKRKRLRMEDDELLNVMEWLASTYRNQGQWTEAEKLDLQVMETSKTVLGPEHPNTLTSISNLALTYYNQGRWTEAEKLGLQVIETRKKVLGPEHPDTLASISNLALTYSNRGRWTEAERLGLQVIETRKKVLGPEHPDTLASISNLALTYYNQGRWTEAEKLELQVMETSKTVLGPEHPDTLTSISNLASTYCNQGRWTEAEKLDLQVMETSRIVLGPEHPDTLTSIANLVSTYHNQGRWTEAKKLALQVMKTRKAVLGPEHPDTLISIAKLASIYRNQGRWTEAEKLGLQVMETRKTVLGPQHPDTLASIGNLALIYYNQGRWTEAEKLDLQAMETRKSVLGPEHPDTLTSMWNLSHTWKKQGRYTEALELLSNCVQLQHQKLGLSHPSTISAATTLEDWQAQRKFWKWGIVTRLFRRK